MASTYVNDLRLNEMATGDESGNWGVVTNLNLELIGEALGYGTEGITTNADTHTTTVADGATDPGRAMYIEYTGTLDSACTITIAPNTLNRMHFIENGTSGSQNIIIKQGSGATITIPPGDTKAVYLDGAGSGAAVVDAFASLNVVDLKVQDDLTVTDDATIGGTLGVTGIVTLTDDLIIGDGKTIGSASDVDAITIAANGQLTLTQTLIGTALDISGDIDVDGTANLDIVDIDGAVDMASTLQVDGAITSSAGATITVADNSDNLTLTSTDADASSGPNLNLYRNSGSPADNDEVANIAFNGRNDNSQDVKYVEIEAYIRDASDGTEDGMVNFNTMVAGSGTSRMKLDTSETVFNDDSVDVDFRVESDGNANMLFVDGGNDRLGIGTATPAFTFDLQKSLSESYSASGRPTALARVMNTNTADNNHATIEFGTEPSSGNGGVGFIGSTVTGTNLADLFFGSRTGASSFATHMTIKSDGDVGIGETTPLAKLHIKRGDSGLSSLNAAGDHIFLENTGSNGTGITLASGNTSNGSIIFGDQDSNYRGVLIYDHSADAMKFVTAASETMRILSTGLIAIGTTVNTVAKTHIVESESRDCLRLTNTRNPSSSAPYVATFGFNYQPNNGTSYFLNCKDDLDGSPTARCIIQSNGGIANYQSNDSDLSDERLKTDIQDAPNALDIINNLKVRTFKYHDQTDEKIHTGLIAQEAETVDLSIINQDGWADKAPDGEEPYKSIYNTDLMFKMLKAIQEQQEQIEQLKTEIQTLKGE